MSLYNMLFGVNALAPFLLARLGLTPGEVPRFRDCYIGKTDGGLCIVILTRTGGGNRDEYAGSNARLTKVEGYICDEDDDFDSTYALFFYRLPEDMMVLAEEGASEPPMERFKRLIDDLQTGKSTPETERAVAVGREILSKLKPL